MKRILKIASLVVILLAIPAGVFLAVKSGSAEYGARAGKHEEVFVFIMPAQVKAGRGERIDLAVKIDTGQETVGGVEILVDFNPSVLRLVGAVRPESAFPELTSGVKQGRISLRGKGSLVGQGTVAILSFEATAQGKGAVDFNEASVVWDERVTTNILGKTTGARVVIE